MSTTTPRVGLYKPADDGSEAASVSTDLNGNSDKIEAGLGVVPVSALPTTCFDGKIVRLTTDGRTYWAKGAMPGGSWVEIPAPAGLSSSFTVNNTATETILKEFMTIPANEPIVGATYRMTAWGVASVTGTPTITIRTRVGGLAGTLQANSGARTASTGVLKHGWKVEADVVCLTTGVSGTGFVTQVTTESISVAGGPPWPGSAIILDGQDTNTWNTTIANAVVLTVTWSAANTLNTITVHGFNARRLA